MEHAYPSFPDNGVVDADGHILEPDYLWTEYLEPKYKDRAICVRRDEDGYEYLEIDGAPSRQVAKGSLSLLGAMGKVEFEPSPDCLYMDHIPYGAANAVERLDLMDKQNVQVSLLYPTIGLLWECEVTDPEITYAYLQAYNRWIADFCRKSGGRLVPIAHLSLLDVERAERELERAVKDGCKGGFVAPFTHSRKPHGHPDYDPLWSKAEELNVPIAIHPTFEPAELKPRRYSPESLEPGADWYFNVLAGQNVQQAFLSFFAQGALNRFPNFKLGIMESGAGWIGALLDRMDAVYATMFGLTLPLREQPSFYFKRQCFISGDPDESTLSHIIDHVGTDKFMLASDYPHPDHAGSWVSDAIKLVKPLCPATRERVLGKNVKQIYGL